MGAVPITADVLDQVGSRLGPYRLLERIGRGAMGSVYRAKAENADHEVALKLIYAPHDQRRHFESVVNEAMASSAVRHPHVVASLSYGADGDHLYIIMELVARGDTNSLVQKQGRLDPAMALEFASQCALGLEAIHAAGFIHRDLKPSNIMLDGDGRARIGDLGLGFPLAVAEQSQGIVGTPAYMSPEQARGEKLDARTDIFSLGATLYFWLTGHAPFHGRTTAETLRLATVGMVADVRSLRPELSPQLAALLHTAMAPQKHLRYADARAFGHAVSVIQEGATNPTEIGIQSPRMPDSDARTELLQAPAATSTTSAATRSRSQRWHIPAAVTAGALVMALSGTLLGWSGNGRYEVAQAEAERVAQGKDYQAYSVSWVADDHLTFVERGDVRYARSGSEIILSEGAALVAPDGSFLLEPLITSGSFSVEVIFRTDDISQSGPARILACGLNHKLANLTIGQSGSRIEVRCRTTMTNTDGTRPSVASQEGTLTSGWHHLAFIRNEELHQLWLDGVLIATETVPGTLAAWDATLPIGIGDEPRGGFPWHGAIRKLTFFTRALTDGEMAQRYAQWIEGE